MPTQSWTFPTPPNTLCIDSLNSEPAHGGQFPYGYSLIRFIAFRTISFACDMGEVFCFLVCWFSLPKASAYLANLLKVACLAFASLPFFVSSQIRLEFDKHCKKGFDKLCSVASSCWLILDLYFVMISICSMWSVAASNKTAAPIAPIKQASDICSFTLYKIFPK